MGGNRNGNHFMGMGGNGNTKSYSSTSLTYMWRLLSLWNCNHLVGCSCQESSFHNTWQDPLTDNTVLLGTARYSPLASCSNDTAVVWVWMLRRIVGWRWRINVELIVQHVSAICQYNQRFFHTSCRKINDSRTTSLYPSVSCYFRVSQIRCHFLGFH